MPSVYTLSSKIEPDKIRYVGITKHEDANARLRTHKANTTRNNDVPLYKWMRKYNNEILAKVVVAGVSWEEACRIEISLIAEYKKAGYKLLNLTEGGEGLFNPSIETRKKISIAHKGKKLSKEQKEKLSKANKGKRHTEETKEKMSKSHSGKTAWNKGKKVLESHRQNIISSLVGRPVSRETREKIKNSNLGKKRSQEAKDNMKEAQRIRREKEAGNETYTSS
jgi:hypothetical protein